MTRISEEKLGEILAGCEGVQFGPWSAEQCDDGLWMVSNAGDVIAFGDPNHKEPDDELPFKYLARLDPTTVSSLVTELRELREALRDIANQQTLSEIDERGDRSDCDFEGGYDAVVKVARAALSGAKL
jgi:hypothetical protein